MLTRREELLKAQVDATASTLQLAAERHGEAVDALNICQRIQAAQAGDILTYNLRGTPMAGHIIGVDGEYFLLMSGTFKNRTTTRVHSRYATGVSDGTTT